MSILLAALGPAVLARAEAVTLFYWLLTRVEAMLATLVTYVVPVAALLWGWLVLSESPPVSAAPGIVLILLVIYIVNRQVLGSTAAT